MPMMLPPDLEQFLQAEVASGKYSSADDIVAHYHEAKWANAIQRMNKLFEQVSGFHSEPRIPRGELYERADSGCVIGEAVLS